MTLSTKNDIIINKQNKILPLSFWIKSMLSFRFISNLSIIVSIIAYYMNAYEILFIFSPLIIVNFIIISYILFTNLDTFMDKILSTYLPNKINRNKYKKYKKLFFIIYYYN